MGLFGKAEKDASVATIELKPSEVVPSEPVKPPSGNSARYTVQDAIVLMRQLPGDPNSLPLVVQVVRSTLASMNVNVEDIIADAQVRERGIEDRVLKVRAEITEFEKEISSRRQQISELETDLSETVSVRERLEMSSTSPKIIAPNLGKRPTPAPAPSTAPAAASSTPNVIVGTLTPSKIGRS